MPATLYLSAIPEAMKADDGSSSACKKSTKQLFQPSTGAISLQCRLVNATYHTSFLFVDGVQDVTIRTSSLDDRTIRTIPAVDCARNGSSVHRSCDPNRTTLRTLSYQFIMDSVAYLITGYVYAEDNATFPAVSTQVISVLKSPNLEYLHKSLTLQTNLSAPSLQQSILQSDGTQDEGLVKAASSISASSLAEEIERLFQNVTVSMMSQEHLR